MARAVLAGFRLLQCLGLGFGPSCFNSCMAYQSVAQRMFALVSVFAGWLSALINLERLASLLLLFLHTPTHNQHTVNSTCLKSPLNGELCAHI